MFEKIAKQQDISSLASVCKQHQAQRVVSKNNEKASDTSRVDILEMFASPLVQRCGLYGELTTRDAISCPDTIKDLLSST